MNAGDVITIAVPASVVTALAPLLVNWIKGRLVRRGGFSDVTPVDLPKASKQSDAQFRAVMIETAKSVESLHEALGQKNPRTGGWLFLESLDNQTKVLTEICEHLKDQTPLLRQIAGKDRPDTTYRGRGGE